MWEGREGERRGKERRNEGREGEKEDRRVKRSEDSDYPLGHNHNSYFSLKT